jgi:hypothetical protein
VDLMYSMQGMSDASEEGAFVTFRLLDCWAAARSRWMLRSGQCSLWVVKFE